VLRLRCAGRQALHRDRGRIAALLLQGVPACRLEQPRDKAQCKRLASKFQDRLLDALMPEKLQIKEAPAIVEDAAPAAGFKARLSAVRDTATAKASAKNDDTLLDWRGTCAICLDVLPLGTRTQRFYECCCKRVCAACSLKCLQHDTRCPLCRAPAHESDAEWLRRVQKHVDRGDADAQIVLGQAYHNGFSGLKKSSKRAAQLYALGAAQGNMIAQENLALCYEGGIGVTLNLKTAALWHRRAAEQGYHYAQYSLGAMFYNGKGVAKSYDEAVRWWRLAAAQGLAPALFYLGKCYANGDGVPQDDHEALRLVKRAAAQEFPEAAREVEAFAARLAEAALAAK